jgi:hypothetical protein
VTDFIARYQYGISSGLKNPVTNRELIGNKPVTDRFSFCNGLYLTSVTNNSCDVHLRSPLPEVRIGNWHCGGQPRGRLGTLMGNGCQTTTVTDVGACNGRLRARNKCCVTYLRFSHTGRVCIQFIFAGFVGLATKPTQLEDLAWRRWDSGAS